MRVSIKELSRVGSILVSAWLLLACSGGGTELEPVPAGGTILAFGDSLTYGVGADESESYPSVLAELGGIEVINAGISGETTGEGLARFANVLDDTRPNLVILMEGGNDVLRNVAYDEIKNNLARMLEVAREQNVPVLLMGVPEKSLFGGAAPFYDELAGEYGLVYMPDRLSDLLRSATYKSDPIHLNAAGYRQLAESIYEQLQDSGAL